MKSILSCFTLFSIIFSVVTSSNSALAQSTDSALLEREKFLVTIGGYNDCHTPGYIMGEGKVPTDSWLTGDTLGWRGPWGTTYAANLRLFIKPLRGRSMDCGRKKSECAPSHAVV